MVGSCVKLELARKLKKAGFPQIALYGTYFYDPTGNLLFVDRHREGWSLQEHARCPTLEELVEECGDDFGALYRGSDGIWLAETQLYEDGLGLDMIQREGLSATEALANLWLALNGV